jgi:hypothetical protein
MKKTAPEAEPDREVVFYYSRRRRLERASPAVRALNEGGPGQRPSLIGSLTATKPLAILFFTIVIFMIFGFILSMLSGRDDRLRIGGNEITVTAVLYEANTILALKKTAQKKGDPYAGAVDLAVSPANATGEEPGEYPVWTQRIFFTLKAEEDFRLAVPFDAPRLLVILRTERGEQALIRVTPR